MNILYFNTYFFPTKFSKLCKVWKGLAKVSQGSAGLIEVMRNQPSLAMLNNFNNYNLNELNTL